LWGEAREFYDSKGQQKGKEVADEIIVEDIEEVEMNNDVMSPSDNWSLIPYSRPKIHIGPSLYSKMNETWVFTPFPNEYMVAESFNFGNLHEDVVESSTMVLENHSMEFRMIQLQGCWMMFFH